jgi:DNA-binding IclR family transcriptional regulator
MLKPTLWRTCRVLANTRRLQILRDLVREPDITVSQVAARERIPVVTASAYLRALNARGLLGVRRTGREVRYSVRADPSVADTDRLIEALLRRLRSTGADTTALERTLTAFTHPRRIAIVQALNDHAGGVQDLCRRCGISAPAMFRHLAKLETRGMAECRDGCWRLTRPRSAFGRRLLAIACGR